MTDREMDADKRWIAHQRLHNQHLSSRKINTVEGLVQWMGALQAQDYQMVKWAIGVRLPGSTMGDIEKAITNGSIIRTHLLRPTWHLVAASDLRWMLELTVPRINVAMRHRHSHLGLTKELIIKSNNTITNALTQNKYIRRKELVAELEKVGFENKDNLASHLLLRAELDGLICSGPSHGKDYTYALLDERVPESKSLAKEEALERLARTYFNSHGPATLEDFAWWSGLTKTSARKALEMISGDFTSVPIAAEKYWFREKESGSGGLESAYLLPAYDEFIISYKDRSALITDQHHTKAVSSNGIFRPIIVVNGQVVGIWKRMKKKGCIDIKMDFFREPATAVKKKVHEAAMRYALFLDVKANVHFSD